MSDLWDSVRAFFSGLLRLDGRTVFFGLFLACLLDWYALRLWGLSLGSVVTRGLPPELQAFTWAWAKPIAQLVTLIVLCQGMLLPMLVILVDEILLHMPPMVSPTLSDRQLAELSQHSYASVVREQAAATDNSTLYAHAQATMEAAEDHRARRIAAWGACIFAIWAWAIDSPQQQSLLSLLLDIVQASQGIEQFIMAIVATSLAIVWGRILLDLGSHLVGHLPKPKEAPSVLKKP